MMWFVLIAFAVLLAIGLLAYVVTYAQKKKPQAESSLRDIPTDCCGAHEVCERDLLLTKSNEAVYFDDEELDELADILPDDFTEDQMRKLADVFYTLRENEVASWLCSLQIRRIHLPDYLKEEALFIVSERRKH